MSRRILYIFPHPDDESFGPAAVIHSQIEKGHDVYLLTLTKGGATQQRHKLGLTVAEMGEASAEIGEKIVQSSVREIARVIRGIEAERRLQVKNLVLSLDQSLTQGVFLGIIYIGSQYTIYIRYNTYLRARYWVRAAFESPENATSERGLP